MSEGEVTPTKPTEQLAGEVWGVLLVVGATVAKVSVQPRGICIDVTRDSAIKEGNLKKKRKKK